MPAARLSLLILLVLLAACGREAPGTLHRPLPAGLAAAARDSVLPVVEAASPVAAAQVEALLRRSLQAAGRLAPGEPAPRLRLRVLAWELAAEPRTLQREHWADDGGPTRMVVERITVRDARAALEARLLDPDGSERALEPVTITLPAQLGPGQHETVRERKQPAPVLLLRGSEAEVLDAVMRRAIAQLVLQITPGERGAPIPLADGGPALDEALRLARAGQLAQAEVLLRAAVQVDPEHAEAAYNLAAVLDAQGRWEEALEWYGRALALNPDDAWRAVAQGCEAALGD